MQVNHKDPPKKPVLSFSVTDPRGGTELPQLEELLHVQLVSMEKGSFLNCG